ncbi:hypothetical protein NFHSH190041_21060 [Shewanella sp. NFH-SH190041]|nr:hypothetical protein NFHSH190041_21060 [Shewanella sp. NFH-SH190041]
MKYWLMKSEPSEFSIEDLQKVTQEPWSGVRNYQARNFMRDSMSIGDRIFFYHSSCATPGIVGIATVASSPYPDMTAMDPTSRYYDAKASTADPR